MERKIIRCFDLVMRASDGEDMSVEGYALKFDKETHIGSKKWGFREVIRKTALVNADLSDVVFSFNHDFSMLLAGTRNKSLEISGDSTGMLIKAKIIDTANGRDFFKMVQEGLITKMSFAATIAESGAKWTYYENDDEPDLREILAFEKFYDVAGVTFPAYSDTQLSARGINMEDEVKRYSQEKEKFLYERQLQKINQITGGNK